MSLVVSDGVTQSEATGQVTVSAALQAAFVPNPQAVTLGTPIAFDSSGSTGNIVSYAWNFGDGGTSAEANPTYTYAAQGTYPVSLVVSDGVTQSEATGQVAVSAALQAAFVPNPQAVTLGTPIAFDSSGSTGNIVSYAWNFGDGGTSAEANPTYTYAAQGTYPVSLVVSDGVTQSEATGQVAVSAALQAAFVPNPQAVTLGTPIAFDSSGSTGNIVSYAWNFGDGGTSAEANPIYTYAAPGTYPVSLVISDGSRRVRQPDRLPLVLRQYRLHLRQIQLRQTLEIQLHLIAAGHLARFHRFHGILVMAQPAVNQIQRMFIKLRHNTQ